MNLIGGFWVRGYMVVCVDIYRVPPAGTLRLGLLRVCTTGSMVPFVGFIR
jgi:hypothetical protein